MAEIMGAHEFRHLAFAQLRVGSSDERYGFLAERCGGLRCAGEKEVTCEDRNSVGPVQVYRSLSSAGVGLVDDVVVVERSEVNQLDGDTGLDGFVSRIRSEFSGDLGEQRAIAFSARGEQVLCDLGEEGCFGDRGLTQACLHSAHAFPHAWNGNEVLEDRLVQGWLRCGEDE